VDILKLVNRILDSRTPSAESLSDPNLHPHGIKELVDTPVARMAYAVVNLLRNLESGGGQARDRLLALRILYDEVLNSAHTMLRRNTARVLMQIMKSMVRAHGNEQRQLKLAHDFRVRPGWYAACCTVTSFRKCRSRGISWPLTTMSMT